MQIGPAVIANYFILDKVTEVIWILKDRASFFYNILPRIKTKEN